MEKKYICVADYQGGDFGKYRTYTAKEWGEQARDWSDSDSSEYPEQWLLENFKNEEELINSIADMWEIQLEELSIDNIEVVEFLLSELDYIKRYENDYYLHEKEWVEKTALEIGLITAELCPHCNEEVLINRKGGKCSVCGHFLKPCSLCDMDKVNCNECKIGGE